MDRGAPGYGPRGGQELDMTEQAHTESCGGSKELGDVQRAFQMG